MAAGLEAIDLTYRIGARALVDGVSLALRGGEVIALVGPNGAGKSTLLKLLAGDLTPSDGRVLLDGEPVGRYRARQLALRRAVLPQQSAIAFAFTAREVVLFGRSPHLGFGGEDAHDHAVVDAAMARTETLEFAGRSFPTLSGGEAQRVTLARVLAQEAAILLLDEPTTALDVRHQQMVGEIAREAAEQGCAVLTVLHDLNLAAGCADRIAIMEAGRLVAVGEPWDVFTEERLSAVFAHPIAVLPHPAHSRPLIVPLPRERDEAELSLGRQERQEPAAR